LFRNLLVAKFGHEPFQPMGWTGNPLIPCASLRRVRLHDDRQLQLLQAQKRRRSQPLQLRSDFDLGD
jgi:hypothetical protein